eukprot:TRINITY_DN35171_c0_g1_i1.p1 TRINITY_DN35171_c0_g1~~TRINITY_DN35171_c0_g1_i1.p1  ORF type:complete len:343 (+),score=91.03 TRINITY_DN35171_c0_g1_i1:56-1030(+)
MEGSRGIVFKEFHPPPPSHSNPPFKPHSSLLTGVTPMSVSARPPMGHSQTGVGRRLEEKETPRKTVFDVDESKMEDLRLRLALSLMSHASLFTKKFGEDFDTAFFDNIMNLTAKEMEFVDEWNRVKCPFQLESVDMVSYLGKESPIPAVLCRAPSTFEFLHGVNTDVSGSSKAVMWVNDAVENHFGWKTHTIEVLGIDPMSLVVPSDPSLYYKSLLCASIKTPISEYPTIDHMVKVMRSDGSFVRALARVILIRGPTSLPAYTLTYLRGVPVVDDEVDKWDPQAIVRKLMRNQSRINHDNDGEIEEESETTDGKEPESKRRKKT